MALARWLESRLISADLHAKLMATADVDPDSARIGTAVAFALLAFAVMLFESLASQTLLACVLAPFLWLFDVPAFGKAALSLTLTAASTACRLRLPLSGALQESVRAFLLLCFIGAVVLGLVDTGQHAGETSRAESAAAGSRIWWTSVGLLGAASFAFLGHAAPAAFADAHLWASVSVALLALCKSGDALVAAQVASAAFICYGRQLQLDEWQRHGVGLLLATASVYELSRGLTTAPYAGLTLGVHSALVLVASVSRDSEFLARAGAASMSVAAGLALWVLHHRSPHYAGLGFAVTYALVLAIATAAIGGWGLRPLVRLPPAARSGVADVLVRGTLLLLLLLVVVGNSDTAKEWATLLDFFSAKPALVNGGYAYYNRVWLLPWSVPVLLYYRALCRFWPSQEERVRPLQVVKVAASLSVGCHCVRFLSWSSLLLALSALTAALPWIDARVCGRAR